MSTRRTIQGEQSKRFTWTLSLAVGIAAVPLIVCSLVFGATTYSPSEVLNNPEARQIILALRLPRVLFALLVGGGLALVGVIYQTLFRNPLASPFTLGVSSGAALGASVALMLGAGMASVGASALGGALVTITLILALSRRVRGSSGESLLLLGIVFSFLCSSCITLLQYLGDYAQLFRVSRWFMGGIPTVTYNDLLWGALVIALFGAWVVRRYRDLDLMLFGDEVAATKGVEVERIYPVAFTLSSLVVGWIVANCGVIGFVGIIVPAVARLLVGVRHRHTVPLTVILGALLVMGCDLLGRVIHPPFEIPAGVFTALLGGPCFIALVIAGRSRQT